MSQNHERVLAHKYEAVFCIVMVVMAYLGRENAELVYPQALYLFLLLLGLNFSAGMSLRLWPARDEISAFIILANCAVITAIEAYSGGADSNLWVLFLLPIYTASLLLNAREAAWVGVGAVAFNAILHVLPVWNEAYLFDVFFESGILIFAAVFTWRMASVERRSLAALTSQREELKRLEKSQERTEKLAELGLSSAGIVHDLRAPLTVINGFVRVMLESKALDPVLRQDLESIRRSARTCEMIVRNVLSAAKGQPCFEPCALQDVVAAAVDLCQGALSRSDVAISAELPARPLIINGSSSQLERIVINLITNAAKAMRNGGRVTVRAENDEEGRRARLLVEDEGPGISEEMLERLFKPFHTGRAQEGGTGLGLYTSRQIAAEHGGGIAAENRPEGGARFTVSLPLQRELSRA